MRLAGETRHPLGIVGETFNATMQPEPSGATTS